MYSSLLGGKDKKGNMKVIAPCALLQGVHKSVQHFPTGYHDAQGRHGGEFAPSEDTMGSTPPMEKFSASQYISARALPKEEVSSPTSMVEAGLKLASNYLSEQSFRRYLDKILELDKEIVAGKESYKVHSIDGKGLKYTPERHKVHVEILKTVFKNIDKTIPTQGSPELVIAGGLGGCLSGDHEYLSPTGWKLISEYDGGEVLVTDLQAAVSYFEQPEQYIMESCDTFYHFKSRGVDVLASGEHVIPYVTNGNLLEIKTATAEAIFSDHLKLAKGWGGLLLGTYPSPETMGVDLSDLELRLMVAICAAGYFEKGKGLTDPASRRCGFRLVKQRKKERLEELLNSLGIPFSKRVRECSLGENIYSFMAPKRNKRLSLYWGANPHQLKVIAEEVLHWNGCLESNGVYKYYSTNKSDIDFISHVFSTQGKHSSIVSLPYGGKGSNRSAYCVYGKSVGLIGLQSKSSDAGVFKVRIPNGYKYCFTTSTGYFITRRGGSITITGNSGKSQFQEPHALEFSSDTHMVLDSDRFKELLPDYDPEKAYLYHAESSYLLGVALRYARLRRANVALDSTMSSYKGTLLDAYAKAGYNLRAVYMYLPMQEAVKRALSRWDSATGAGFTHGGKGRLVPAHVILEMNNTGSNFDKIAKRVNSWAFYRNDDPVIKKAVKVADSRQYVVKSFPSYRSVLL